jgi:beta-barrel assembly-enhancing protease
MKALLTLLLLAGPLCAGAQAWSFDIGSAIGTVVNVAQNVSVSDEQEIAIGQAVAQQLLAERGLYADARAQRYVNLVGFSVLRSLPARELPYSFAILDCPEVNAYACPGGPVFITRGLWEQVASEAELAGVIGHELAHIAQRHAISEVQKANMLGAVSQEALSQTGYGAYAPVADFIVNDLFTKGFSRSAELEADKLGTAYAAALGYYPAALQEFLDRCLGGGTAPAGVGQLFSTHPAVPDRVAALQEQLALLPEDAAQRPQLVERLLAWRSVPAE